MTGLFELFAFSGISPFRSYLLYVDNADAPELLRSFPKATNFVILAKRPPISDVPDRSSRGQGFSTPQNPWFSMLLRQEQLERNDLLAYLIVRSIWIRSARARFFDQVTNQVPHSHRNSIACRNAPFDRILSFLERMPRGVGSRAYGPT